MQILFAVNQAEAIRRGFDSNSTVKLNLDIPSLPQDVRNFIADRFLNGSLYNKPVQGKWLEDGSQLLEINQPDLVGVFEAIGLLMNRPTLKDEVGTSSKTKPMYEAFEKAAETSRKAVSHLQRR